MQIPPPLPSCLHHSWMMLEINFKFSLWQTWDPSDRDCSMLASPSLIQFSNLDTTPWHYWLESILQYSSLSCLPIQSWPNTPQQIKHQSTKLKCPSLLCWEIYLTLISNVFQPLHISCWIMLHPAQYLCQNYNLILSHNSHLIWWVEDQNLCQISWLIKLLEPVNYILY